MRNLMILWALLACFPALAADTIYVKGEQTPLLIERKDNVLLRMRIDAQ